MVEAERTILWSAESVAPNNTSITLYDSIDNYDELIYYGSATRTYCPCVMTEYPVISGVLNLGGPYFYGIWTTGASYHLSNGTQVFLSGNSGYIATSYYWGKQNGGTAYEASLTTNRTSDVRPYKIVGVKYPSNYDRTTLWESDHTSTLYNTNISLYEPVTHFKQIMVLGSGFENGGVGCRHASKNIYNTQNTIMGCDAWAYTPWKIAERHNLVIGQEMRISGNSGYIGSGYFMGMGNQTTAWAAGKWNADYQFSATAPYAIFGINRKTNHKLKLLQTNEATISANSTNGYEFDTTIITATPYRGWDLTGYELTGATLTGNEFMWNDNDVTATPSCSAIPSYTVTILPAEHGSVIASMPSGYRGEIVTLTNTPDEGWYYGGYDTTGCTINKYGEFVLTADAIIQPKFSDVEFRTLTLLHSEGGTLTANELTGVPGDTINLSTAYNTYWRFSGYQLTGDGEIVGNDYTFGTEDATICACYKKNAFTANGNFEKGSNANYSNGGAGGQDKYGVMTAHTGDIPASWYSTSNRWNPSNASAYNIAYTGKMTWTGSNYTATNHCYFTARMYVGGTTYNQQVWGDTHGKSFTFTYSKTGSVSNQGYIRTYGYGQTVKNNRTYSVNVTYIATGTNGTWRATGYAP